MASYFQYLKDFLVAFFQNLGRFFSDTFAYPWAKVPGQFEDYANLLRSYSNGFGFLGWFLYVVFAILFVGLIGAIIFFLVYLIRKYVKFYKKQLSI